MLSQSLGEVSLARAAGSAENDPSMLQQEGYVALHDGSRDESLKGQRVHAALARPWNSEKSSVYIAVISDLFKIKVSLIFNHLPDEEHFYDDALWCILRHKIWQVCHFSSLSILCLGCTKISRRAARRLIVLHPKQNIESEHFSSLSIFSFRMQNDYCIRQTCFGTMDAKQI